MKIFNKLLMRQLKFKIVHTIQVKYKILGKYMKKIAFTIEIIV